MLKRDSRRRSLVGRMFCDFGAASVRPPSRPPMMRIQPARGGRGPEGRRLDVPGPGGRAPGRLFRAFVALAPAQWAGVVAVAAGGGRFAAAALVRTVAIAKHAAQFPALLSATRRFGRPRGDRGAEIATGLRNDPGAKLRANIFCFDFLDGAFCKRTEPERPEFDPDQAIDLKAEMGKHVAHLAVLALADRK